MRPNLFCAVLLVAAVLVSGCSTEDIYIQDSTVFAPLQQRPIHTLHHDTPGDISFAGGLHVFPKALLNGRIDGHSPVGKSGELEIDTVAGSNPPEYTPRAENTYTFEGRNLHWNLPPVSAHAAVSINISSSNYVRVGGQYARLDGVDFAGVFGSLGFFTQQSDVGTAFELGYDVSRSHYRIDAARIRTDFFSDHRSAEFLAAEGDASADNYFMSLTVNTMHADWPVNLVFRLSMDRQGVFNHGFHGNDVIGNVDYTATIWSFVPAAVVDIGKNWRLNAGIQVAYDGRMKEGNDVIWPIPLVELEWKSQ